MTPGQRIGAATPENVLLGIGVALVMLAFLAALAWHFVRITTGPRAALPEQCSVPATEGEALRIVLTLREGRLDIDCRPIAAVSGPRRARP